MKICSICKKTFGDESIFCSADGNRLDHSDAASGDSDSKPSQASKSVDPFGRFEIEREVERSAVACKAIVFDKEMGKKAWAVIYPTKVARLVDRQKAQKLMQLSHPNLARTLTCNNNAN